MGGACDVARSYQTGQGMKPAHLSANRREAH